MQDISLRAESLQMPGRSLNTQIASANIYGPQREYVTEVLFAEEINMTFQATDWVR